MVTVCVLSRDSTAFNPATFTTRHAVIYSRCLRTDSVRWRVGFGAQHPWRLYSAIGTGPLENSHEYRPDFDDIHQLPSIVAEFIELAIHSGCRFGAWNLDKFHAV